MALSRRALEGHHLRLLQDWRLHRHHLGLQDWRHLRCLERSRDLWDHRGLQGLDLRRRQAGVLDQRSLLLLDHLLVLHDGSGRDALLHRHMRLDGLLHGCRGKGPTLGALCGLLLLSLDWGHRLERYLGLHHCRWVGMGWWLGRLLELRLYRDDNVALALGRTSLTLARGLSPTLARGQDLGLD